MNQIFRGVQFSIFLLCQLSFFVAAGTEISKKPWTVLVYLNADNSLEDDGYNDLREMERVGSNDNVNVVVQFDPVSPQGTKRLYVKKAAVDYGYDRHSYQSKVVEDMPEQDMGDYKVLVDFVTWGMQNYPAENYMVVIWNHGSGWDKDDERKPVIKGISYDDTSDNHITTNQLAEAIDEITANTGNKINILGFDACLMSMFEVVDSLAGMVDYVVGSEETEPGDGYPYDDFLKIFTSRESPSALAVAKHLVDVYGKSYAKGGSQASGKNDRYDGKPDEEDYEYSWGERVQEVTLSAIDLSRIELVKRRLSKWLEVVDDPKNISLKDHLAAVKSTVSFAEPSNKDLGDYVKNVLKNSTSADGGSSVSRGGTSGVVGTSLALLHAIQSAVVANSVSSRFTNATGISIYLPYSYYSSTWGSKYGSKKVEEYKKLKWAKTSEWTKHLDYLFPKEIEVAPVASLPTVPVIPISNVSQ